MFRFLFLLLCALMLLPVQGAIPKGTDLSQLNKGDPEKSYRKRKFSAYYPESHLAETLRITSYGWHENPTGILFTPGEIVTINMHNGPAPDQGSVQLIVKEFSVTERESRYPLEEGENKIEIQTKGLGYIDYRSPRGCKAPQISLTIKGGVINGVFTRHDDRATWRRLLRNAQAFTLDMIGERVQVIYPVEDLRKFTRDKGVELLAIYDRIVELEQNLMGWEREGIHPGSHILCRVAWHGFMFAATWGSGVNQKYLDGVADPELVRVAGWGIFHEFGHNHQFAPGFDWIGMAEVTNNLLSQWCNYSLQADNSCDGAWSIKGPYDRFLNEGVLNHRLWQYHVEEEKDAHSKDKYGIKDQGDVFVTLTPLWQLLLYCQLARNDDEFYPKVFQLMRAHNVQGLTHGQARVNFCRFACEAAGLDLSDYMLRTGMLGLVNRRAQDYGKAHLTVNEEMVTEVLKTSMTYPEPDSSVIHYISAASLDIYRERRKLIPSNDFRPAIPEGRGKIIIPHEKWKNAVAFEVYKGDKLIRICLRSLGFQNNTATTVICPPGATCIKAVQWDGTRYVVTGDEGEEADES